MVEEKKNNTERGINMNKFDSILSQMEKFGTGYVCIYLFMFVTMNSHCIDTVLYLQRKRVLKTISDGYCYTFVGKWKSSAYPSAKAEERTFRAEAVYHHYFLPLDHFHFIWQGNQKTLYT